MTDHLPECALRDTRNAPGCICVELRACEERVLVGHSNDWNAVWENGQFYGRKTALIAAREVVAALAPTTVVFHGQLPVVHNVRITEALAAIDALLEAK